MADVIELISDKPQLKQALKELCETDPESITPGKVAAIAAEQGVDLSADEVHAAFEAKAAEVGDADLAEVTGGAPVSKLPKNDQPWNDPTNWLYWLLNFLTGPATS